MLAQILAYLAGQPIYARVQGLARGEYESVPQLFDDVFCPTELKGIDLTPSRQSTKLQRCLGAAMTAAPPRSPCAFSRAI